jgi:NTE family protein
MLIDKGDSFRDVLRKPQALRSLEFLDLSFRQSGLLKGERFTEAMHQRIGLDRFDELRIPLRVVASDYWCCEQVVFSQGELFPAIRASMSLPGIFVPVEYDGRILIDGGGVNPVPHDILDDCDVVIAIDVMGVPDCGQTRIPGLFSSVIGMFNIMQQTIIEQRLIASPPNLYLKPDLPGVDILDFHRSEAIYAMAEPARHELESWLTKLLDSW